MKMNNFLVGAFATMALFSCNNDNLEEVGGDTPGTGKETWASFNIQVPKTTSTRAADTNATAQEVAVNNVAVYLVQEAKGSPGKYLITASGIKSLADYGTLDGPTNTIKTKIALKAPQDGLADIWVVLNPTAAIDTRIMSTVGPKLNEITMAALVAEVTGGYKYATEASVAGTGFVMVNNATVSKTLKAGVSQSTATGGTTETQNRFTVNVERAVAKISVESKHANLADLNALPLIGAFSNIKYSVYQINPNMQIARWTDKTKQPGGFSIVTPGNDNDGILTGTAPNYTYWGNKAMDTAPLAINPKNTAANLLNGIYTLENSMKDPLQQNATYALIQATWAPTVAYEADGTTVGTLDAEGNFWYYNKKYYVEVPTELAADATAAAAAKYTKGTCYYRVYLYDRYTNNAPAADGERFYDVVRNTCYRVTLNSIIAPGENTPTPPGPGPDPIVEPTHVSVDVNILAWSFANMDDVDLQ